MVSLKPILRAIRASINSHESFNLTVRNDYLPETETCNRYIEALYIDLHKKLIELLNNDTSIPDIIDPGEFKLNQYIFTENDRVVIYFGETPKLLEWILKLFRIRFENPRYGIDSNFFIQCGNISAHHFGRTVAERVLKEEHHERNNESPRKTGESP